MNVENQSAALSRLAERLAALERHVFEQDKEMLAMSRQLEQLRAGFASLRDSVRADGGPSLGSADHAVADERPPHY